MLNARCGKLSFLYMCACVCACERVHTYVCAFVCAHTCVCVGVCTRLRLCVHAHICVRVCAYLRTCVCVYTSMHIYLSGDLSQFLVLLNLSLKEKEAIIPLNRMFFPVIPFKSFSSL